MCSALKYLFMFETELFLAGMGLGLLLAYLIIPRILIPKLRERLSDASSPKKRSSYQCKACHSSGRHKNDCPENPKNKKAQT
jgi:hypothetical protein